MRLGASNAEFDMEFLLKSQNTLEAAVSLPPFDSRLGTFRLLTGICGARGNFAAASPIPSSSRARRRVGSTHFGVRRAKGPSFP